MDLTVGAGYQVSPLFGLGADVNALNRLGCTPLMEPVIAHKLEAVHLLVKHGADPHITVGLVVHEVVYTFIYVIGQGKWGWGWPTGIRYFVVIFYHIKRKYCSN